MSDRLDALTVREYTDRDGNKKSSWTKIGSAWPNRDGGFSITLDALPLPTMGERGLETRIVLMVPKPREDQQDRRTDHRESRSGGYDRDDRRTQGGGGFNRDLDDEIPFAPEWR